MVDVDVDGHCSSKRVAVSPSSSCLTARAWMEAVGLGQCKDPAGSRFPAVSRSPGG